MYSSRNELVESRRAIHYDRDPITSYHAIDILASPVNQNAAIQASSSAPSLPSFSSFTNTSTPSSASALAFPLPEPLFFFFFFLVVLDGEVSAAPSSLLSSAAKAVSVSKRAV